MIFDHSEQPTPQLDVEHIRNENLSLPHPSAKRIIFVDLKQAYFDLFFIRHMTLYTTLQHLLLKTPWFKLGTYGSRQYESLGDHLCRGWFLTSDIFRPDQIKPVDTRHQVQGSEPWRKL